MDSKYYLLISTGIFGEEALELHSFEIYSELWQYLQDRLFYREIKWYQIFWGDVLMMQKMVV